MCVWQGGGEEFTLVQFQLKAFIQILNTASSPSRQVAKRKSIHDRKLRPKSVVDGAAAASEDYAPGTTLAWGVD